MFGPVANRTRGRPRTRDLLAARVGTFAPRDLRAAGVGFLLHRSVSNRTITSFGLSRHRQAGGLDDQAKLVREDEDVEDNPNRRWCMQKRRKNRKNDEYESENEDETYRLWDPTRNSWPNVCEATDIVAAEERGPNDKSRSPLMRDLANGGATFKWHYKEVRECKYHGQVLLNLAHFIPHDHPRIMIQTPFAEYTETAPHTCEDVLHPDVYEELKSGVLEDDYGTVRVNALPVLTADEMRNLEVLIQEFYVKDKRLQTFFDLAVLLVDEEMMVVYVEPRIVNER